MRVDLWDRKGQRILHAAVPIEGLEQPPEIVVVAGAAYQRSGIGRYIQTSIYYASAVTPVQGKTITVDELVKE